jgi:hypothetical protein
VLGRQLFKAPLDNIWQTGPRLTLGRSFGHGSDVTLSYQWYYVAFDTRETVTAQGFARPGTSLRFEPQSLDLSLHHVWDEARYWHSVTRLGLEWNDDNGAGYFDYTQYRVAQQIKFAVSTWELSAQFRYSFYDYSVQTVSATDLALRQKTGITASARVEKSLGKQWKVFASYAYDQSLSNVGVENYTAGTTSVGAEWHF